MTPRLHYNSPVTLPFALAAVAVHLLSSTLIEGLNAGLFAVGPTMSLVNPLDYWRLLSHVLGHAGFEHLFVNLTLILLLGPILEEKYGSLQVLEMIVITALVTGVLNVLLFPTGLMGASGIVFMFNGENPTSHLNWTLVDFAEAELLGLATASWFLLIVTLAIWFLMSRTVHGCNAYAIGDNREAAVNAGIRVGPHVMINFAIIGFLAALSAVQALKSSTSARCGECM